MTTDQQNEHQLSKQAFAFIEKHNVAPSPENYAVWYHYALAKNKELLHEINNILSNNLPFTQDTSAYLYNKYILTPPGQKTVDDAANGANKVLLEVMSLVNNFSGETTNYNKDVNSSLDTLTKSMDETNVKSVVQNLIAATSVLKRSGERMQKKLEDSKSEITNLRKNLDQVTAESQRDFLTGAYNRKTFEKFHDDYVAHAKQTKTPLCMIVIDIDHFKKFNDRFGHLIGDEVLKIVVRTLIDSLKGRDIVARFGGEEFIVLLQETPIDIAMKVADMVRKAIASKELKRKDTGQIYGTVTVSMGVSEYRPQTDTLPTFLKRADDALYQSKHDGRNRVTKEA